MRDVTQELPNRRDTHGKVWSGEWENWDDWELSALWTVYQPGSSLNSLVQDLLYPSAAPLPFLEVRGGQKFFTL